MTLHLHRAVRSDQLVAGLADLLSRPLPDPFATEVVGVPTPGVERWLAQSLSHRLGATAGRTDGVCAGVVFSSPRRLLAQALAAGTRVDPASDPWAVHRAVWPLLTVVDQCRGEPWAAPLWSYLTRGAETAGAAAVDPRGGRRFATAQHLAELFARYAAARPTMINHWLVGADVDGQGRALAPDRAWQAEIWRRLRAMVGVPSPAERLAAGRAHLRAHPESADLPQRLSIFGPTRLEPDHLPTLAALAAHRDVHLWLSHPSPALWTSVAALAPRARGPRREDPAAAVGRHRLLRYLGRDLVELERGVATLGREGSATGVGDLVEVSDDSWPEPPRPDTLLGRLQHDLAQDVALPIRATSTLRPDDDSITLHACHGPDRQVEVLREVLLGLLADDPTLEPRDVIVMCPDIEAFAPLISAAFGLDPGRTEAGDLDPERLDTPDHPGHRLRVRLADRSLRQLNPMLALVSRVLRLAGARITAADLLDLLATPPVRRRFALSDDDLVRLHDLVPRSGVRWGLDADHRSGWGMAAFGQNTWSAGLDRLLLGVTMGGRDEHFIGTALPMADIDSSDVELVGRLAEAVDRVGGLLRRCAEPQSLAAWVSAMRDVVDGLGAVPAADSWQLSHAYAALGDLLAASRVEQEGAHGDAAPNQNGDDWSRTLLSPADVRTLLDDTLRGRPSRSNFRTGTLTFATLAPMRSVPHRVVCLLGIDDGVFPRTEAVDGDDLLAADPWVGDRDRRSEDRQLLLDAITSATERLVVLYTGADARTGRERPPAVPIGELLDTLEQTVQSPDTARVRTHLVTRHPLQAFDPRNFSTTDRGRPRSFDRQALAGARALAADRPAPVVRRPLVLAREELPAVVPLTELVRFFQHPARTLLRARAGLWVGGDDEPADEQIPTSLHPLQGWAIGDRMLHRRLAGADLEALRAAEWRRGELPPRNLGDRALEPVLTTVATLEEASRSYRQGEATTLDLDAVITDVRVGDVTRDLTVTGTAHPLYGDRWVTVSYSRLAAKHRLAAWLQLLTLDVTRPGRPWQIVTLGRGGRSVLGPLPPQLPGLAVETLRDLLELYAAGQHEVLPLPVATAAEYARIRAKNWPVDPVRPALAKVWDREVDDAWRHVLEPPANLDTLLSTPVRPTEQRGPIAEPSRFGMLATRVWSRLLWLEELS
ncbi:MAG: exodeoxyribonuclease V subunit gamma [Propionibacteriaceae bacterium]